MSDVVRLTVVPEAAQLVPGERLSLALTLQHTGHTDAHYHYRLHVSGVPADWYDLDPPRVALLPAASAQVLLTMHPPADAVACAGRYSLTVQVQAEEDPALQAATVVALTVRSGGGLDMDVQPVEAVGRQGLFGITFLNQLTWPVCVALTARDHENGLRFRIEPATAVVVPATGVAGPIMVHVAPKVRALLGAPHPYEIQFQATELGDEDKSAARLGRRAHFVYVPRYSARRLPVWLRRGLGWASLFPLALLFLR
jgi:hypothetical protein